MSFPGLLLALIATAAEPPSGPVAGPPALIRGDRIPFTGEVTDDADKAGRVTKRIYALDVSLFVLEASASRTDCALFTQITPKSDPGVIAAVANVMGTSPASRPLTPITRLDLIRIDNRGRVSRLIPPGRTPFFLSDPKTKTEAFPPLSLDEPPITELGMFVPLPETSASVGASWTVADRDRPARTFTVKGTKLLNGGQCLVITAVQQSAGYADLAKVAAGWQRYDGLTVSPTDGLARVVDRQIVHREGNATVQRIAVNYEIKPIVPHAGKSYRDVRAEIETAAWLGAELDKVLAVGGKPEEAEVERIKVLAKRHAEDRPATVFRPAVEAVMQRAEAALGGRALGDGR